MNKVGTLLIALAIGILAASMIGPCKTLPTPPAPAPAPPAPNPSPLPDGFVFGRVNQIRAEQCKFLLELPVPVVAQYSAAWCAACQRSKPHLEEFAKEVGQDALVVAFELTEDKSPFEAAGIKSVPTLVVSRAGKELGRKEGVLSATQLAKFVDGALHAN